MLAFMWYIFYVSTVFYLCLFPQVFMPIFLIETSEKYLCLPRYFSEKTRQFIMNQYFLSTICTYTYIYVWYLFYFLINVVYCLNIQWYNVRYLFKTQYLWSAKWPNILQILEIILYLLFVAEILQYL